jgi:hypothetical protein
MRSLTSLFCICVSLTLLTNTSWAHRTAQEAAEASAAGGLRHRGGNPSYEGLGCASTPEGAFRSCCYANHSGLETYDVGIAQGRNGLWVCCRRYVSKGAIHRIGEYLARAGLKRQKTCVADCFETVAEEEESE